MFDIGWMELLLIGVVALIVVGPKELPVLFRTVGRYMGKARGMAREFQRSMEQAADESGLKEASEGLKAATNVTRDLNLKSATQSAKSYAKSTIMGDEAKDAAKVDAPAARQARPDGLQGRGVHEAASGARGSVRAGRRDGGRGQAMSPKDDIDDSSAPLIEHLAELRTRLIYSVLAFTICMLRVSRWRGRSSTSWRSRSRGC